VKEHPDDRSAKDARQYDATDDYRVHGFSLHTALAVFKLIAIFTARYISS
jgi:hypothetical protein